MNKNNFVKGREMKGQVVKLRGKGGRETCGGAINRGRVRAQEARARYDAVVRWRGDARVRGRNGAIL
eukprot:1567417-Pleurochrysis_carterae.AAC.1